MDTDVLIVGAGPVGLALAASLSRRGTSCRIVDQSPSPTEGPRPLAFHSPTLEALDTSGLADIFVDSGFWIRSVELNRAGRVVAHVKFDELKGKYHGVLSMSQAVAEGLLIDHLGSCGIRVERPYRLVSFHQDSSSVESRLEHNDGSMEIVRARWMVGCDGAQSKVRQHLGIEFEGMSKEERFLLADVRIFWPLPADQFSVFLHPDGLLLAMPMPGGSYHVAMDVSSSENISENPDVDEFRTLFARRVPVAATLSALSLVSSAKMKRRLAAQYRVGRVFLAGNSAHLHTPAAGQGTNAGMHDAVNLAWKLDLVVKGKAREELLDTYVAERAPMVRSVFALTDRLLEAATLKNSTLQTLRHLALPLLAGFDLSQQNMLTGPAEGTHYRKSPIVQRTGFFAGGPPLPGDRAPVPWTADSTSTVDSKAAPDSGEPAVHNLLLFGGERASDEDASMLHSVRRDFEAAYPGLIRGHIVLGPSHAASPGAIPGAILDSDGSIHRAYGATKPVLFLIRPDSYIAYRSHPVDAVGLHEFVRECYGFQAIHENPKVSESGPGTFL